MTAANTAPTGDNRVVLLRRPRDSRLDWLCTHIARNRFLPVPPVDQQFVGDGDFRAIGTEFLRHFVQLGGLMPHHRVLEVGCGIGRMALPLTQYLDGGYDGVDVVEDGIRWCADTITPAYPQFRFHHLDVANGLYNPGGRIEAAAAVLPFEAGSVDFVILTSVITHLRTVETARYAAETARLLKPGGRVFLSLFLVDGMAREGIRARTARPAFDPDEAGPEFIADPTTPNAAVAYDETFLLGLFAAQGLRPARPVARGHWSGRRDTENFQDLLVLEKPVARETLR
ncbi:MAG TPA: class I SAM-dependent methyltransferase [Azospirillum sp.]|nr:class I SAM-dependent methyltransferase [Azospirillum sp.]